MTEQEIIEAIRTARDRLDEEHSQGAITTYDLALKLGVSQTTAHRRVRELVRTGKAEVVRVLREDIAGRSLKVTAYRLKP